MKSNKKIKTPEDIHTKISVIEWRIDDKSCYPALSELGGLYSHVKAKLYNTLFDKNLSSEEKNKLKRDTLLKYKIPGRLYNSILSEVEGSLDSQKELIKERKVSLKKKINKTTKLIKQGKMTLESNSRVFDPAFKTYKRRKLTRSEKKKYKGSLFNRGRKLCRLTETLKYLSLRRQVFGSRTLYKKQWTDPKYKEDHAEWLRHWRDARTGSFNFIGTAAESCGNQLCQFLVSPEGAMYLRVRKPDCLVKLEENKYLEIPINLNLERNKLYYKEFLNVLAKMADPENPVKLPLSYRFIKKENGFWYVQCTFRQVKTIDYMHQGCIGIDVNHNLLATATCDQSGNFIGVDSLEFKSEACSSEQAQDILSKYLEGVVKEAADKSYYIAVERLDLCDKKLEVRDPVTNKKLHSIPYRVIYQLLVSKCFKHNVLLKEVNPAYTSVIGYYKYRKMYGLSGHSAAALCIARRGLGFKERLGTIRFKILQSGERSRRATGVAWEHIYRSEPVMSHWSFLKKSLEKSGTALWAAPSSAGGLKTLSMRDLLSSRLNPTDFSFVGRS